MVRKPISSLLHADVVVASPEETEVPENAAAEETRHKILWQIYEISQK